MVWVDRGFVRRGVNFRLFTFVAVSESRLGFPQHFPNTVNNNESRELYVPDP